MKSPVLIAQLNSIHFYHSFRQQGIYLYIQGFLLNRVALQQGAPNEATVLVSKMSVLAEPTMQEIHESLGNLE